MSKKQSHLLTIFGSTSGNILEWYDYLIYLYLTPILSGLLFPGDSSQNFLIYLMQTFAISHLARPLGSLFFGPIADRYGRKPTLVLSTILMGIVTFLIAIAPVGSPKVLTLTALYIMVLRVFQGFSVGGEYLTTSIYLIECAPKERRGLFGSFINYAGFSGIILASSALLFLFRFFDKTALYSYAWRIPFFFGSLSLAFAFFIRLKLKETPVYEHLKKTHQLVKHPIRDLFKTHKKELFIVLILVAFQMSSFYAAIIFLNLWAINYQKLSFHITTISAIISSFVAIIAGFLGGYLCDKIESRIVLIAAALVTVLLAWPTMVFMTYGGGEATNGIRFIIGQSAFQVFLGIGSGAIPIYLIDLFKKRIYCTGILFSYNLSAGIFGGTAPLICMWLIDKTGMPAVPSLYLTFFGIITIIVLMTIGKRPSELAPDS